MAFDLRTFNSEKLIAVFVCPAATIDMRPGLVKGPNIDTTRDEPTWTREMDANGNAVRVRNFNEGGTAAFTYMADSPTNGILSAVHAADKLTEGSGVGVITIKDLNGSTLAVFAGAFLEDKPPPTFGTAQSQRVWTFQVTQVKDFVGGANLA